MIFFRITFFSGLSLCRLQFEKSKLMKMFLFFMLIFWKGYNKNKLHVASIPNGKYANWNFQYRRYLRNNFMKLGLSVSCSHDYCADPNNIIFEMSKGSQNWCVQTKSVNDCMETCIQFRLTDNESTAKFRFWNESHTLQISWFYRLEWKILEKSFKKNQYPMKLQFSIWSPRWQSREKINSRKTCIWIVSFLILFDKILWSARFGFQFKIWTRLLKSKKNICTSSKFGVWFRNYEPLFVTKHKLWDSFGPRQILWL